MARGTPPVDLAGPSIDRAAGKDQTNAAADGTSAVATIAIGRQLVEAPFVWLGQSVDTSVLLARYPATRSWPTLTSLADGMRRTRYLRSHFHGELRTKMGLTGPIMLDSGGFVLMTRRLDHWTVENVAEIYRRVDADVLVSLDHPVSHFDSAAVSRRKRRLTLENFSRLHEEFGPNSLMPVVHGRTIQEIEESCAAIQAISPRLRWVGIGGLVPLLKQLGQSKDNPTHRRQSEHFFSVIRTVKQAFPRSFVHVFGVGAPRSCLAAFAVGAHSTDSQGWRHAAGFGSIFLPGKGQRILEWNQPTRRPRPLLDEEDRHLLGACRCPACMGLKSSDERIQLLRSGFEPRSIHNAWVLYHEVASVRLALLEDRLATFLAARLPHHWLEVILSARR